MVDEHQWKTKYLFLEPPSCEDTRSRSRQSGSQFVLVGVLDFKFRQLKHVCTSAASKSFASPWSRHCILPGMATGNADTRKLGRCMEVHEIERFVTRGTASNEREQMLVACFDQDCVVARCGSVNRNTQGFSLEPPSCAMNSSQRTYDIRMSVATSKHSDA